MWTETAASGKSRFWIDHVRRIRALCRHFRCLQIWRVKSHVDGGVKIRCGSYCQKVTYSKVFIILTVTVTEIFLLTVTITVIEKISNLNHTGPVLVS